MIRTMMLLVALGTTGAVAQTEVTDSIYFDGHNRSYILHLPPAYSDADTLPLVMVLHGGTLGSAETALHWYFDEVGDVAGYLSLFPQGYLNNWADGRGTDADLAGIDDVAFLNALLDTISGRYAVDRTRRYVTGASNGGFMTQRLAAETPESFAAFASIIATMTLAVWEQGTPGIPVSMLMMNGTADPMVPYEGGTMQPPTDGGEIAATDSVVAYWLRNNGSTGNAPDSIRLPDTDTTDGSTVDRFHYGFGTDSSEVVLYRVNNGGHTMPGMYVAENPTAVGFCNQDIKAARVIWNFFKQHARDDRAAAVSEYGVRPSALPAGDAGVFDVHGRSRPRGAVVPPGVYLVPGRDGLRKMFIQ